MKKIFQSVRALVIAFAIICVGYIGSTLLQSNTPAPTSSPMFSSTYYINGAYPVWYGAVDTIKGAGVDTVRMHITSSPKSIEFSNDFWHQAGATTLNVTATLYGSSNNGVSYDSIPLAIHTINPTNVYSVTAGAKTRTYIVNPTFGGSPMTDYMWCLAGTAATTIVWQGTGTLKN